MQPKKYDLVALADRVSAGEVDAVEAAVTFVEGDTRGLWHGGARAKLCRRFKHVALSEAQRTRVVSAVLGRLVSGQFSEQFRDQLRTALLFDRERTLAAARAATQDPKPYIRRFGQWVLSRHAFSAELVA